MKIVVAAVLASLALAADATADVVVGPADPSPPADVVQVDPTADDPPGVPPGPPTQVAYPAPADPSPPADAGPVGEVVYSVRDAARRTAYEVAQLTGGRYVLSPCRIGRPSTCRARTTGRHGCRFRIVVRHDYPYYDVSIDRVICKP